MTADIAQLPYVEHFTDDDDLYAYLARLNEDGHACELGAIDANGIAFLATLTDPDADRVHHVVTNESGRAHCCTCEDYEGQDSKWQVCTWRPTYPVVALSQQNPATVRAEIAKAAQDNEERHAERIRRAQEARRG